MSKLLKDLLYGGRNEYLDLVRVLAFLGGLVFLGLVIAKYCCTGEFSEWQFAMAWGAVLAATSGAIWGRTKSDRIQHEDAVATAPTTRGAL